jgi:flagellar motor protein MotB
MSRRGVFVDVDERNGILRLPESLLFPSGSADFSPQGRQKVAIVANELASELPCYALGPNPGRRCPSDAHAVLDAVFIEGHTDSVPITGGPYKDNWDLSAARSRHTYQALVESSPALNKIWNANGQPLLSISAYGDTRPLTGFKSLGENQKHSRRIDLRFIVGTPTLQRPADTLR